MLSYNLQLPNEIISMIRIDWSMPFFNRRNWNSWHLTIWSQLTIRNATLFGTVPMEDHVSVWLTISYRTTRILFSSTWSNMNKHILHFLAVLMHTLKSKTHNRIQMWVNFSSFDNKILVALLACIYLVFGFGASVAFLTFKDM